MPSIDNNGQEVGQSYLNGGSEKETKNGTTKKVIINFKIFLNFKLIKQDENNSRHSKFYDPNGNSTQSSGIDSVESENPESDDDDDDAEIIQMEISQHQDDRIDEPVSHEQIAKPVQDRFIFKN